MVPVARKELSLSLNSFIQTNVFTGQLMQIIEPYMAKGMYEYSCGSIPKRGIHYAQKS